MTDEADEDGVARPHVHLPAVGPREAAVVERGADLGGAVGAEGAVHADGLHEVAQDLVVRVGRVPLGLADHVGPVLLALGRGEVEVEDLRELVARSDVDVGGGRSHGPPVDVREGLKGWVLPLALDSRPWLRP